MMYAPHILEKRTLSEPVKDEFDNIISEGSEVWTRLGPCRCDDNTTKEFKDENGKIYTPSFHIVTESEVKAGDYIRCMNGEEVRGKGKAYMVKRLNFLPYVEIWV